MYVLYSAVAAFASLLVLRSVVGDLFAQPAGEDRPAAPAACLDDVERLFAALSARAAQPMPRGLSGDGVALEWDRWSRRWEDDASAVSNRCRYGPGGEQVRASLTVALESLENLRRELGRSGQETADESRRVRDALAAARSALRSD